MEKKIEKKVLFVIDGLRPGGTERVFVNLINNLGASIEPVVVVLESKEYLAHDLKNDVETYYLCKENRWDVFRVVARLAWIIRQKKPEAIMSFGYYANHLVVLARYISGCTAPVCISERSHTASALKTMNFRTIRKLLLKATYRRADRIVAVSETTKAGLISCYDIRSDRIRVIHNPIDLEKVAYLSSEEVGHPWFDEKGLLLVIGVGRLVAEKGFPYLMKAFSIVSRVMPNSRLIILGEGQERARLEKLKRELELEDRVDLLGYQRNPYKFMARAHVFVLSSWFEGFPNVVLEAMACGLPVIASRGPTAAEEIITHGENGLLVHPGDEHSLAKAMLRLLGDRELRGKFERNGKERVREFSLEKIVMDYEDFLLSL